MFPAPRMPSRIVPRGKGGGKVHHHAKGFNIFIKGKKEVITVKFYSSSSAASSSSALSSLPWFIFSQTREDARKFFASPFKAQNDIFVRQRRRKIQSPSQRVSTSLSRARMKGEQAHLMRPVCLASLTLASLTLASLMLPVSQVH